MKYSLLIAIITISTIFCEKTFPQSDTTNETIVKTIQKNGLAFLKNKNINSTSIGIYKDGKMYTEHFGEIEKGKSNPPDDGTIYEIGSVTKTMTGYLVARAVLEKKIKLEDEITMYLKDDYSNLQYNGNPITIKHLLTHTSGLPMFLPMEMNGVFDKLTEDVPNEYFQLEKSYDKEKFLADLKNVTLKVAPGTTYSYSNAGAELIGYVLETVFEKNIDNLMEESYLTEYGMSNTAIELNHTQKQELVQGYWMDNETFSPNQLNTLWATGGGVKMIIMDMMHYIALQLNSKNPIVSESHKVLYEECKTFKISYFWRVWNDKYGTSYNHHGGTSGTQNWLFIFPRYDLGISIITNQSGPKTPKELSRTVNKMLKDIIEN
ncbi:beta-lactamase family protein [Subsaximicrobium wynnwilliamsii]|uniref:Beta-lactamase family protein n=1 Tax=Subsaximicrobium wynnwilliamsii TaxID=291179 RepID=A0A5C6ZEH4_9FLAO|nr:serine hydrolase domain-containing protein [Subsaximicrobium wynnwilliamsii]TXD81509.1 beta-lactamase family protein [Subsaximicrobium wynnwilliamsii]TXD87175.1 beta-lactamase family protein [Subsaximicrobium wynnwilliamsii]TXE00869.1 beta-lactamase family protein [Subsaximicrobium wynnwilliamsii]